jgi:enoyl-CoA hydratase
MGAKLRRERQGDVVILTLDRPQKRNALDPELCDDLAAGLADAVRAAARAVVLTGAGDRAFCAGFDLQALQPGGEHAFDALIDAVVACPLPIVAALQGAAFGGGCELAATCDLRVAHEGVELAMPPARLGIVYAARGLARFSALVGESRARQLFLLARTIDARTAFAWGLVDELVAPEDVGARALALATEMAALAPLAVQGMRRTFEILLRQRTAFAPEEAAEVEKLRQDAVDSADLREALQAFGERRAPVFRGA